MRMNSTRESFHHHRENASGKEDIVCLDFAVLFHLSKLIFRDFVVALTSTETSSEPVLHTPGCYRKTN